MYIINTFIDGEPTQHDDMDSAIREFADRQWEHSETLERTETAVITHDTFEMEIMRKASADDIAADKRHNQSFAA